MDRPTLLILGAGPAGLAAGIAAAQCGLQVLLLEIGPRRTFQPGETLHPGVEPVFRMLGVWPEVLKAGFLRHQGIWKEGLDGLRSWHPYGSDPEDPWEGIQVNRQHLHSILLKRASQAGVLTCPVGSATEIQLEQKAAFTFRLGGRQIRPMFVLDATGHHAWLSRELNLGAKYAGPTQRLKHGWMSESEIPSGLQGQPLHRELADGWDWIAPLGDGWAAWVKLRRNSGATGRECRWRYFPECAGDGYFLLGDAACLMDPSAANGVLRAMMSGILAVHLAKGVVTGRGSSTEATHQFKTWFSELFHTTASRVSALNSTAQFIPQS